MSSPEASPSYSLPDFVVPHDGTQPEVTAAEQAVVAVRFSSLVGDLLLSHIEAIEHWSHSDESHLWLNLPVGEDESWSVKVESSIDPDEGLTPEQTPSSINLQRMVAGSRRAYLSYRLGSDGVVRRRTINDMAARSPWEKELDFDLDDEMVLTETEVRAAASRLLEQVVHEVVPNDDLEEAMGYNMQPVGLAEIEGLKAFLSQPGLE